MECGKRGRWARVWPRSVDDGAGNKGENFRRYRAIPVLLPWRQDSEGDRPKAIFVCRIGADPPPAAAGGPGRTRHSAGEAR